MKQEDVDNLLSKKMEDGEHISPILPDGIKNYLIDIDGTICDDIPNEEPNKHGFKFHGMVMGKPRGGNYHWIDNHLVKATRYNGKFTDLIDKKVTIEVFDDGQHE